MYWYILQQKVKAQVQKVLRQQNHQTIQQDIFYDAFWCDEAHDDEEYEMCFS